MKSLCPFVFAAALLAPAFAFAQDSTPAPSATATATAAPAPSSKGAAFDACDGKSENDPCSFLVLPKKTKTVSGTCIQTPKRGLACTAPHAGKSGAKPAPSTTPSPAAQ